MKLKLTVFSALAASLAFAANLSVDFDESAGKLRHDLHSSGFGALLNRAVSASSDKFIKEMNMKAARTHDWALINAGARVADYQHIFPLPHLDPKDPKNYYFKPTDYLLQLQRDLGLEIFFRLGVSIEHTGLRHFNAIIPENFDTTIETFAATIRHYNKGWADGFNWDIKYWEIWNEPDGYNNMWSFDGKDDFNKEIDKKRRKMFVEFFVKSVKRLKAEFPDIKVGGPALCGYKPDYFKELLVACKNEGVIPDFISWHYYGRDPDYIIQGADRAKKLCEELGMPNMEFIINEWHYLPRGGFAAIRSVDPKISLPAKHGPSSINGIDSACFTMTTLVKLQSSNYSQSYYYGCRHTGSWGYRNEDGKMNKNFYTLKLFGSLFKDYAEFCKYTTDDKRVIAMPLKGADGKKALLVVDYLGDRKDISVQIAGLGENAKVASVTLLSDTYDLEPYTGFKFNKKKLSLTKPDAYSAVYLVKFE